jgi:hypothetical protein
MAASEVYTDWHLTPRGWTTGTVKTDAGTRLRQRPADAVLTLRYRQVVATMLSTARRSCTELRRSADAAHVKALLRRFGRCPGHPAQR